MKQSKKTDDGINPKVALISAPWPVYNRPSIQLGALKAYIRQQVPGVDVRAYHFYLNVAEALGFKSYHAVSESSWLAETVYAAMMYPEHYDVIESMYRKLVRGVGELKGEAFDDIVRRVSRVSDELINGVDWNGYGVVGVSVCLCQLTSSLYFVRKIREACPGVPMVIGGSVISGMTHDDLFLLFPEIDAVVTGEGEAALATFVKHCVYGKDEGIPDIPGLCFRETKEPTPGFTQIKNLDSLPVPDYSDYFQTLASLPASKRFFPTLPAEISRGCWWHRVIEGTEDSGCAFCNLNLQWRGYRSKSPERVVREVDVLTSGYKLLSVAFTDNALPVKKSERIFDGLSDLGKDFSFFCEIRAAMTRKQLESMKRAGCRYVQVGVEALSSNLLFKLNKGTTAIENLEIMKHCEELGIVNGSNLMIHFPGSDQEDVDETLNCLEYACVYRPMKTVRFQLGLGSPVNSNPGEYGVLSSGNHSNYKQLFPEAVERSVMFPNRSYRGDIGAQRRLWKPVADRVQTWQTEYEHLHRDQGSDPILSFRDGRNFLIIKRRHYHADNETHRLTGPSRMIYLFCRTRRSFDEIKSEFQSIPAQSVFSFLTMMTEKKLMFEDDGVYLSLAISVVTGTLNNEV